jgi:hypothetical protein
VSVKGKIVRLCSVPRPPPAACCPSIEDVPLSWPSPFYRTPLRLCNDGGRLHEQRNEAARGSCDHVSQYEVRFGTSCFHALVYDTCVVAQICSAWRFLCYPELAPSLFVQKFSKDSTAIAAADLAREPVGCVARRMILIGKAPPVCRCTCRRNRQAISLSRISTNKLAVKPCSTQMNCTLYATCSIPTPF